MINTFENMQKLYSYENIIFVNKITSARYLYNMKNVNKHIFLNPPPK